MWRKMIVVLFLLAVILGSFIFAKDVMPGIPREETIIIEDPSGRSMNPSRFNIWGGGVGSWSTGLQQLALDTLWYIDPDEGIEGETWLNSLAAEPPIYNEDFTKMTVKLRKEIYWSDGIEFTADDVIYTVKTLKAHPEMTWGAYMQVNVDKVYKTDDYTVVFELTKSNGRFHSIFTVRWSACYIMPKHVFEKVEDPVAFDFNPPVSLGAYVLKDYDPNGYWFLWEKRKDWQRTSLGMLYGEPGPKYVLYKGIASPEKKVMDQMAHNLDIIHDLPPEGAITLVNSNPYSKTWFDGWPWAHPDPTLPSIIMNHEQYPYNLKEVRWALTLAIDIVQVVLQSYNGCATISPIHVPPTGHYLEWYFDKVEPWLKEFSIKVGDKTFKPYDPTIPDKIAQMVKYTFGYKMPDDPKEIRKRIGYGWWKYSPETAGELLKSVGFKKDKNGKWLLPNGKPWKINILCESATRSVMTRAAIAVAEQWRKFGIDAQIEAVEPSMLWNRMSYAEDPDTVYWAWCIETWGGHPDLFWFLESWHSDYYRPTGEPVVAKNPMRFKNEKLDVIIDELRKTDFFKDTDKIIDLGLEYIKLSVEEMPIIPVFSYNVFTVCDEYYWTDYPSADDPYTNPVPNWANTKYMFIKLKPAERK